MKRERFEQRLLRIFEDAGYSPSKIMTITPEEMVEEAIRLGLDTVGISDHSHLDPCGMTLEQSAEYRTEIARLKNDFYAKGATYAAMSGSGSAVFALFPLNS